MIKYGLISEVDARCIEKTIDLICDEFKDEEIKITEVGIYSGETGYGIRQHFLINKKRGLYITGIDNGKDGEQIRHFYDKIIIGNSTEVYNQLEDNSQHMIFIDGDHSYIGVISDFFAYCGKVKVGGCMAFHDTGKHIAEFKDFQHGDRKNPDAYISVRKSLVKIGMFNDAGYDLFASVVSNRYTGAFGFRVILDEYDTQNEAGGVIVLRRKDNQNWLAQ